MHGSRFTVGRIGRSSATLAVLLALALAVGAAAQSGGYDLSWWTVDGGGYTWSEAGAYALGGTIGQPDAGALEGGGYSLVGGFWGGAGVQYRVYLPLLLRRY